MIKEISKTLFEVDNQTVSIVTKKGRRLIICSCFNSSYFGHNNYCRHIQAVLHYIYTEPISKKIDEMLKFYEMSKKLKRPLDPFCFIDDLIKLKDLIKKTK